MKTFAKILSIVLCLTMVIGMFAVLASAAEGASISFADTANRTSFSEEEQVWAQNGITVTNSKAESKSNVADYSNPARFYAGSSVTVAYAGMKQINFNCNSDKHATNCLDSINADANANAAATANGKVVTVVFTDAVDSFTISSLVAQVRVDSIDVYTSAQTTDPEPEPDPDPIEVSIVDAIEIAKEGNGKLYIVRGTIAEITNTTWGNGSIVDADGNELDIYGMYSADGSLRYDAMEVKPVAGDEVVLLGELSTYKDTPQIKNAKLQAHTPGEVEPEPEPDPVVISIADANAKGAAMEHNTYTAEKYIVTGVIVEIANETYGNMYIQDAEGNKLYVYGVYAESGERYDAMPNQPKVGDTVTLVGIIGQYNGNPQMKNAVMTARVPAGPSETGDLITLAICGLLVSGGTLAILPKKREN